MSGALGGFAENSDNLHFVVKRGRIRGQSAVGCSRSTPRDSLCG